MVGEMRRGKVEVSAGPQLPPGDVTSAHIFTLVEGTTLTYDTQQ